MFGLMKELPDIQVEAGEVNLSSVIRTFDGMYILEVEDRALSDSLEAEISGLVGQGRFELLMEAAEESEQMRIYIVRKDDVVTDFLCLPMTPAASVISISGGICRCRSCRRSCPMPSNSLKFIFITLGFFLSLHRNQKDL